MKNQNKYTTREDLFSPTQWRPRAYTRWTPVELASLRSLKMEGKHPKEIARELGRSEMAVRVKLSRLNWSWLNRQRRSIPDLLKQLSMYVPDGEAPCLLFGP